MRFVAPMTLRDARRAMDHDTRYAPSGPGRRSPAATTVSKWAALTLALRSAIAAASRWAGVTPWARTAPEWASHCCAVVTAYGSTTMTSGDSPSTERSALEWVRTIRPSDPTV